MADLNADVREIVSEAIAAIVTQQQSVQASLDALKTKDDEVLAAIQLLQSKNDAQDASIQDLDIRITKLEQAPTPTPTPDPNPDPTPPPSGTIPPSGTVTGNLSATLTFADNSSITFNQADGTDCGDYIGETFTQHSIKVDHGPWTVFFRPDKDSDRREVVFELGRCWGDANAAAANVGAYTAVIKDGDTTLATVSVSHHNWFGRWRWQSTPRPVIRERAAALQKLGLPPFDETFFPYCSPSVPVTYAGPMDNAGIYMAMGTVGDRPDIGPVTEWEADYLATGSATALKSVFAQGEGAGSIPWHMRDEETGAPVNFITKTHVQWWRNMGDPGWLTVKIAPTDWLPEDSHTPALSATPFVLTDDPYYLEELQHQVAYVIGGNSYHRDIQKLYCLLYPGETRAFGWGIRSMAQVAALTPANVPSWLLPKSYWEAALAQNYTYFNRTFIQDTTTIPGNIFHAATRQDTMCAWQEGYMAVSFGIAARLGYADWKTALAWKIDSTVALNSGQRGWNRQWGSPYEYYSTTTSGTVNHTWVECWADLKARYNPPIDESTFPPFPATAQNNSWGYPYQSYAALVFAKSVGITSAEFETAFSNCHAVVMEGVTKPRGPAIYRWSWKSDV